MARFFDDVMDMGVDGISAGFGLTCTNPNEAEFLRAMASHSKRRIVVCDHSKLNTQSKWTLCPAEESECLITDEGASDDLIRPFEALGIEIVRV